MPGPQKHFKLAMASRQAAKHFVVYIMFRSEDIVKAVKVAVKL